MQDSNCSMQVCRYNIAIPNMLPLRFDNNTNWVIYPEKQFAIRCVIQTAYIIKIECDDISCIGKHTEINILRTWQLTQTWKLLRQIVHDSWFSQ